MLIPSIDLHGGRIVQLIQGERLAVQSADVEGWIRRFASFSKVQLIDLDAAKSEGANEPLVARICGVLPCRVGGGIRSVERARAVLGLGATHVIVGSSFFRNDSVDVDFAGRLAAAVDPARIIAAVDSRAGRVVIHGWRTALAMSAVEAIKALEPFVSEFLYTHVDREGLMQGTDLDAVLAVRAATVRRVTAAGGITTMAEVEQLSALGVDAVVGMAIYTGRMNLGDSPRPT